MSQSVAKTSALCSALKYRGTRKNRRKGPTSSGSRWEKPDFDGRPAGAAKGAQDVEHDGDRAVADLVGRLCPRLNELVAQGRLATVHPQRRNRATGAQGQETDQALQGRAHVGLVFHQQTHQPQGVQPTLLPDQQPEVLAAGPGHAMGHQTATRRVGNHMVGVVEQMQVEAHLGQYLGGIGAQAPEHRRDRQRGADVHGGGRRAQPRRA